jgi:hypothetical protein
MLYRLWFTHNNKLTETASTLKTWQLLLKLRPSSIAKWCIIHWVKLFNFRQQFFLKRKELAQLSNNLSTINQSSSHAPHVRKQLDDRQLNFNNTTLLLQSHELAIHYLNIHYF